MFKYTGKHRCRNNTINCWLSWIGFLPSTSQKLYGYIKPNPGMTAIMRFQLMSSLLTSKARSGSDDISHSLPSFMITTNSSSCLSWFDFRSVPWYDLLYFFTTSVSVWIYTQGVFFNCSLPKNCKYRPVGTFWHLELFMMRFYCIIQQKELLGGTV